MPLQRAVAATEMRENVVPPATLPGNHHRPPRALSTEVALAVTRPIKVAGVVMGSKVGRGPQILPVRPCVLCHARTHTNQASTSKFSVDKCFISKNRSKKGKIKVDTESGRAVCNRAGLLPHRGCFANSRLLFSLLSQFAGHARLPLV